MYTILSRKFWLGVGLGFFASSMTLATFANAQEHVENNLWLSANVSACANVASWTGTASSSNYSNGNYLSRIVFRSNTSAREYYMHLYADGDIGGTLLATATSTNYTGSFYGFTFPQHINPTQTYDFVMTSDGNSTINRFATTAQTPDEFTMLSGCVSGSTPSVVTYYSVPVEDSSQIIYIPVDTEVIQTVCETVDTITTCNNVLSTTTASTTIPFTPENTVYIAILFLMVALTTYYITTKLL